MLLLTARQYAGSAPPSWPCSQALLYFERYSAALAPNWCSAPTRSCCATIFPKRPPPGRAWHPMPD